MSDGEKHSFIERAIADGHAELIGEGKTERIHYVAAGHSERWSDPEEKVRAEFWAELIYKYDYSADRIRLEVNVPRRTPNDYADIVIYSDTELKAPYFVLAATHVARIGDRGHLVFGRPSATAGREWNSARRYECVQQRLCGGR